MLGGEGRLGRPVVSHLARAGHDVVLLRRGVPQRPAWLPSSAVTVTGDATSAASLRTAASGCDAIHVSISGPSEGPAVRSAVEAATAQGVGLITYVSGSATFSEHARFPVIRTKLAAEETIQRSGIDSIIFCPSFSMEVLPMHIQRGRAVYFGKQPWPFHWLAGDDLGNFVATAYGLNEARNTRLFLRGPEALKMDETLRRYCAVLHPAVTSTMSLPFWAAKVVAAITRDRAMKTAVDVYEMYQGVGGDGGDPAEAEALLGRAPTGLDAWLRSRHNG